VVIHAAFSVRRNKMFIGIGITLLIGMGPLIEAIHMIVTFKPAPALAPPPEPQYSFIREARVVAPPLAPEQIAEFNNMRDWR